MKFDILTLFPEMFEPIKQSVIGKATEKNLIEINLINIRDFSENKHKKVDDTPYGGGAGMVMVPDVVDEEISIGDYVLTGGEIPAMVLIDSVSRYVKGVLKEESIKEETFSNGLLEYPQYTRPEVFLNKRVPEVLLSGHHENIKKWREEKSLEMTKQKRPDLLEYKK